MINCQRESEENYASKKIIKEKKQMLRKILRLFPSGIMFYSKAEGIFYKNKFWMDLLDKFKEENSYRFWENKRHVPLHIEEHLDDIGDDPEFASKDKETQLVLDCLYLKENINHTLKDEILKIHDHFYHNNVEYNKINEYGVDDFIYRENIDFNEYEIKDSKGKQIAEFSAKFTAFNFSPEDRSIMVVVNDISEKARMREAKLRETKISEMLKTIMLCSISHELRSPVNQINGVLTLLLPTLETKEQQHLIKIANSSTELLKLKVDDMLDFYEVETNNFKMDKKAFDPRQLFIYLKAIFSPVIDKHNVKLNFFIHEKTPEFIFHDIDRIKQVLANIMSNAVKYTKKGSISAFIDWKYDNNYADEKKGTIKFTVSDSGCGIPRQKKKTLFNFLDLQNFMELLKEKEGDFNTTKLAGTGLGISQKIINGLKSKIEFSSTEGLGSKFWFTLRTKAGNSDKRLSIFQRYLIDSNKSLERAQPLHPNYRSTKVCHGHVEKTIIYEQGSVRFKKKLKRCPSMPIGRERANHSKILESNYLHYTLGLEDSVSVEGYNFTFENARPRRRKSSRSRGFTEPKMRLRDIDITDVLSIPEEDTIHLPMIPIFVEKAGDLDNKIHKIVGYPPQVPTSTNVTIHPNVYAVPFIDTQEEFKRGANSIALINQSRFGSFHNLIHKNSLDEKCTNRERQSAFANYDNLANHKNIGMSSNETFMVGIEEERISSRFKKMCNCPSVLIVDDQYINRYIIKQF